jgi:hypothetical protein
MGFFLQIVLSEQSVPLFTVEAVVPMSINVKIMFSVDICFFFAFARQQAEGLESTF